MPRRPAAADIEVSPLMPDWGRPEPPELDALERTIWGDPEPWMLDTSEMQLAKIRALQR